MSCAVNARLLDWPYVSEMGAAVQRDASEALKRRKTRRALASKARMGTVKLVPGVWRSTLLHQSRSYSILTRAGRP